ncbi:MAG: SDR family oxidoreductase [Akkermansiaceae bacterium]|jgi:NAD(P)-dependent dehydrogenase (short-subunit alcohol dehydrogenase family)|nr:SDR family oxidoreductase [Akkermansiaceae bacterium]
MKYIDYTGKNVVVTGGTQGIGRNIVKGFHQAGATVWFCGREVEAAQSLLEELGNERVTFSRVDLTQPSLIQEWFGEIREAWEGIDVLINNAGVDPRIPIEQMELEDWDRIQNTNLRAYFLCAKEASELLSAGSTVINISSITFDVGMKNLTGYVSSKGGIIGFTRSLAREWGERSIRVNTLSPGAVFTDRQVDEFATPELFAEVKEKQCLKESIEPEAITDVALFLGSPLARSMTGQNLRACHGWTHG